MTADDPNVQAKIMNGLQSLLLEPQQFIRGYQLKWVSVESAKQYLDSYKKNREEMSLLEQPRPFFVPNGEMDVSTTIQIEQDVVRLWLFLPCTLYQTPGVERRQNQACICTRIAGQHFPEKPQWHHCV
jgi:hypothetical protein